MARKLVHDSSCKDGDIVRSMVVGHTEKLGEMAKKNVRINVWIIIAKQIAAIDYGGQEKIKSLPGYKK